jgi:polygalacturonase
MDIENLSDWFITEPFTKIQQEVHIANFSCESQILVTLKVKEQVNTVRFRPKSRDVKYIIEGSIVRFSLPGPDKIYIEVNDLPPLCFFANPLETYIPDSTAANVRYFGPGVHNPGMMTLKDDDILYIAGGAVVYGGIRIDGSSNIKVLGRGILDGKFKHRRMVVPKNGKNIEFNGIMIRNGVGWTNTVINCSNVLYKDIKVISFGPGGDGINPLGTSDMEISNCFLRCTDDCIAIKSPDTTYVVKNITIKDNTMIGYAFSDGITIGFETNGPVVEDVVVSNCDILLARGGSRVDGHSAFSIICDGPATIRNILYENIRVDEEVLKLFELHITDGSKYGINPPGHIKDIHLKNIEWSSQRPIILKGFDEMHRVQNITFENCSIEGEILDSAWPELFEINEYVDNVQFVKESDK